MIARQHAVLASPKIVSPTGELQYLCKLLPSPWDLFVRRFGYRLITEWNNKRFELRAFEYNRTANIPSHSGSFMFFRASALATLGGFDPRYFMYLEDLDLSRRAFRMGACLFEPRAVAIHEHGRGSYTNWRLLLVHIRSALIYFGTYGWAFDSERVAINREVVRQLFSKPTCE
jgi:N-acetylglucosaminyl-diphospho-decaprenol L-rhamnosyltransferase